MQPVSGLTEERLKKLEELKKRGIEPYPYKYEPTHHAAEIQEKYASLKNEEKTNDSVCVAGRIMIFRRMGKATFASLQDQTGKIQLYFREDNMGLDDYDALKLLDAGDWIGVEGSVFKTKTGEVTVFVNKFKVLCKSILPLPEKYHGLQDKELRYRQRYLDLIVNPEVKERFIKRSKVIELVRQFLNGQGFLEVETPVLQVLYGGTNAKPFTTYINAFNMPMYLRVAPELYLKRLVVAGFERIYEIARNFRNEGVDQTHNPEFTMIEWYEAYADYHVMMDRAEAMYRHIAQGLYGSTKIQVHDKEVDLGPAFPRIRMVDSIKKYADLDVEKLSEDELISICQEHKLEVRGSPNKGTLIFEIFDKLVAPGLLDPVWIIDYPKEVSPLSKVHRTDPRYVERFECYVGGKEIGDGWSEITDPIAQRERFEMEQAAMRAGQEDAHPMDEDFIVALEYGMPTLGGIGIGIDRLVMLFTNCWSIRDVIFFPTMKPLDKTP